MFISNLHFCSSSLHMHLQPRTGKTLGWSHGTTDSLYLVHIIVELVISELPFCYHKSSLWFHIQVGISGFPTSNLKSEGSFQISNNKTRSSRGRFDETVPSRCGWDYRDLQLGLWNQSFSGRLLSTAVQSEGDQSVLLLVATQLRAKTFNFSSPCTWKCFSLRLGTVMGHDCYLS